MKFTPLELAGAFIVDPDVYQDERGAFFRFYCEEEFKQIGHNKTWVQLNHSITKTKGTIRGMHYQLPPHAEIKLVKCISGSILDVIVDLRKTSATFLKWTAVEISDDNRKMLYIPEGFAHGFQSLSDNCELIYHHSAAYRKDAESGLRWNDPLLQIAWPIPPVHISERDQQHPLLTREFTGIKF